MTVNIIFRRFGVVGCAVFFGIVGLVYYKDLSPIANFTKGENSAADVLELSGNEVGSIRDIAEARNTPVDFTGDATPRNSSVPAELSTGRINLAERKALIQSRRYKIETLMTELDGLRGDRFEVARIEGELKRYIGSYNKLLISEIESKIAANPKNN